MKVLEFLEGAETKARNVADCRLTAPLEGTNLSPAITYETRLDRREHQRVTCTGQS